MTIFGGDGCRGAHAEVVALAQKLKAPVGYAFRGKQYLEFENPNAVGMTGLIGFGGAHRALHEAEVLLLLGTDFPFSEFLPDGSVKKVQIDREAKHLGRRMALDLGLVGNVKDTIAALLPLVGEKATRHHLDRALERTREWDSSLADYVKRGPSLSPIRPEYPVATLDRLAADDAFCGVDTGTPCIWAARYLRASAKRSIFGSFTWASMASAAPNAMGAQMALPGRQTIALSGDGGFTMLALGDMLTLVERKMPVVVIVSITDRSTLSASSNRKPASHRSAPTPITRISPPWLRQWGPRAFGSRIRRGLRTFWRKRWRTAADRSSSMRSSTRTRSPCRPTSRCTRRPASR